MGDGGTRKSVGRFRRPATRERFLAAYRAAFAAWPGPRRCLDIPTAFGTTHVTHYGPDTGDPFVLLHGHGANASTWAPQVAALGAERPVYAVDTIDDPGGSVQTAPVTGSTDAAAWLDEVLAGLGTERAHLVGLSYGGWLALNQAVYASERLATVTLLDPGGLEKVRLRFYASTLGGALATLAPRRTHPWFADKLANHALVMPRELLEPVMIGARSFGPQRSAARPFTDTELRRASVPMLVLLAGRSVLLHPERARDRVLTLVPHAEVEIVPGAGHGLPLEAPDLVNERILKFVEGRDLG